MGNGLQRAEDCSCSGRRITSKRNLKCQQYSDEPLPMPTTRRRCGFHRVVLRNNHGISMRAADFAVNWFGIGMPTAVIERFILPRSAFTRYRLRVTCVPFVTIKFEIHVSLCFYRSDGSSGACLPLYGVRRVQRSIVR